MAFKGWLLKIGSTTKESDLVEVPMEYIQHNTYTITPNQRLEASAERDTTGVLHRSTAANTATKIEFETTYIYNDEVAKLNKLFRDNYINTLARSIYVQYYNIPTNSYMFGKFYMPDVEYTMMTVDIANKKILYNPVRFALIEYGNEVSLT